ncbi:hypothetical protein L9F63_017863 [Diploptera punctata]|uniref:Uncharacterized protein n=1 Tax=Diploptera punctata TaxID=6984 RepID=A0AAD7ZY85_DIPPU|nr:hypothetical protein L9F63_017863 [Diploptera punctata]
MLNLSDGQADQLKCINSIRTAGTSASEKSLNELLDCTKGAEDLFQQGVEGIIEAVNATLLQGTNGIDDILSCFNGDSVFAILLEVGCLITGIPHAISEAAKTFSEVAEGVSNLNQQGVISGTAILTCSTDTIASFRDKLNSLSDNEYCHNISTASTTQTQTSTAYSTTIVF